MKTIIWIFIFCSIIGGFATGADNLGFSTAGYKEAAEKTGKRQILVLNAYNQGYDWTDSEVRGIMDEFKSRDDVVLRIEYMDTKMINTEEHFARLFDLYANKYRESRFDIIISTDDDALRFLRKYRDRLFPGVPVVFCGVNYFNESKVAGFSLYTGVNEVDDFKANLELIARLHPRSRTLYVINDLMTTGKILREHFDKAKSEFADRWDFIYLDEISMDDLLDTLRRLPPNSIVYYLSFFKDKDDETFTPHEALPQIADAAPVPIYGSVDYMMTLGIVGGKLKKGYFQGEMAGKLAKRVLEGEDVSSIPVVINSPNKFMFDFERLVANRISISKLPAGSILVNEPETFYYKYKKLIWTVVTMFLALWAFIVALLFNIRKRKRAQKGLQAIIDSSSTFLDLQSMAGYKKSLMQHLSALFPISERMLFFKLATDATAPGGGPLIEMISDGWKDKEDRDAPLPAKVTNLLGDAVTNGKSVVSKKNGIIFFANAHLPGNLVYVEGQRNFDDLDRDLMEIYTSNASMALETVEKHKIEESLEMAKKIQMSMLPTYFEPFSRQNNVDLHAYLAPAKEVGGDLYDFFPIDDDHICVTVGDVSDKGVPAALFMVMTKTLLRSTSERNLDPSDILFKVNNFLNLDNEQSMFVTQFLAILKLRTGELRYANAGHNPPYKLSKSGEVAQIHTTPGMVLGAYPGSTYVTEVDRLEEGEGFLIYSDGVTEAMNADHDTFDEQRLEAVLADCGQKTSREVTESVVEKVREFARGAPQSDDITVLFMRKHGDDS